MTPRSVCLSFFWALALTFTTAGVCFAQDTARYEEVRGQAKSAFASGNYEEAAQLFREAFDISPKGNLLYNIGLCYERAGNVQQAVIYYERFVQALPDSPKRPAVQQKIAGLKTQLDDKFVVVKVSSTPPGAVIFVDDKAKGAMGATPLEFKLIPGEYTIIAELKGYEPVRKRHSVRSGGTSKLAVRMMRAGEMAEMNLFISERGANVMINGKKIGRSPLPKAVRLPAGSHEISIMKPGFAPYKKTVELQPGAKERVKIDLSGENGDLAAAGSTQLDDEGGGGSIWPWVTIGAGVALVGGGVATGLSAQNLHDTLDSKSKNDQLIAPADIDTGNQTVLLTNGLFALGGAAIVGGVIWLLLDDSGVDTEGSLSGSVLMTPDGDASVGLMGRF